MMFTAIRETALCRAHPAAVLCSSGRGSWRACVVRLVLLALIPSALPAQERLWHFGIAAGSGGTLTTGGVDWVMANARLGVERALDHKYAVALEYLISSGGGGEDTRRDPTLPRTSNWLEREGIPVYSTIGFTASRTLGTKPLGAAGPYSVLGGVGVARAQGPDQHRAYSALEIQVGVRAGLLRDGSGSPALDVRLSVQPNAAGAALIAIPITLGWTL